MSLNPSCEICKFSNNAANLIFKTNYWKVVLSHDQAYLARSYVTLLDHKESLSELSQEEWLDFKKIVPRIERGYEKALGSGRPFNWSCMMNLAFQEESPAPHVHWHIRPRHEKAQTIRGQIFNDPEYGFHYRSSRKQLVDQDTADEICSKLKANI